MGSNPEDLRAERREAHARKDGEVKRLDGERASHASPTTSTCAREDGLTCAARSCVGRPGSAARQLQGPLRAASNRTRVATPTSATTGRYIDDRSGCSASSSAGCGALVENEVARVEDPVLRDIGSTCADFVDTFGAIDRLRRIARAGPEFQ